MPSVCVFLGGNPGYDGIYLESAIALGEAIAEKKWTLIYGGGASGLMGKLADTVLDAGGKVIGVMPTALVEQEPPHQYLTHFHLVESMHERKAMMTKLADSFVTLPGGLGTFEELFEIWSATKIKLLNKPIGLLNVNAYFDNLIAFLEDCAHAGFIEQAALEHIKVSYDVATLLRLLAVDDLRP